MKTCSIIIVVLLIMACLGQPKTYSSRQQNKDLKVLKDVLLNNTGNPYLHTDSVAFEKAFSSVGNNIINGKTDFEWFEEVSYLVSLVKCGHTSIMPSQRLLNGYLFWGKSLPIELTYLNRKLIVAKKFKSAQKKVIPKFAEIKSINGVAVSSLAQSFYNMIAADAQNTAFKRALLKDLFGLYYFLKYPNENEFSLRYKVHKDSATKSIVIKPGTLSPKRFQKRLKKSPFFKKPKKGKFGRKKINKEKSYGYLQFDSFFYNYGNKYDAWLDAFFAKLKKDSIQHLIIDLRNNLGGKFQHKLLSYLTPPNNTLLGIEMPKGQLKRKRNFKKFNKYYWQFALLKIKALIAKRPNDTFTSPPFVSPNSFAGKVIVITSNYTFSSAANLASNLKYKVNALMIGKTTGGGIQGGNTGQLQVKLPKSKYKVGINPIIFKNGFTGDVIDDKGVVPDIYVHEPLKYSKSNDPYMQAALQWITKNQQ